MKRLLQRTGQGTTEMIFLIPLFVILATGAISIAYICWQGIKVQEAANMAARIAGQETVGGAKDLSTMMQDNGLVTTLGVNAAGDPDPGSICTQTDSAQLQDCLTKNVLKNPTYGTKLDGNANGAAGVYWNFRRTVYKLFTPGEQQHLYVPTPQTRQGISEISVTRVMQAPKVFGWQAPPVSVDAKAYGGEDPYMYALPRFGHTNGTGPNSDLPFWQQVFKNHAGQLKDPNQDQ